MYVFLGITVLSALFAVTGWQGADASVLASSVSLSPLTSGVTPCTPEDAYSTLGKWTRDQDVIEMNRFVSKATRTLLLQKADRVIPLLEKAVPNPKGVNAKVYRSVRGQPHVEDGAIPFAVNSLYLAFFCVPADARPEVRGTVLPGGETETWIYIEFNTLGWLMNGTQVGPDFKTAEGVKLFWVPKPGGEVNGQRWLLPNVNRGRREEAIVMTPDGRSPFHPITRAEYLEVRDQIYASHLEALEKQPRPNAPAKAKLEDDRAKIKAARAALSPEKLQAIAFVKEPWAVPPNSLFVSEAEGGWAMGTVSGKIFYGQGSPAVIRVITVYLMWDPKHPAESGLIREFKERFDFHALQDMLGR